MKKHIPYIMLLACLLNQLDRYIDLEEYDNAKAELDKALAAHPNHISCLHNMASVHEHEKNPEKAKEYLNKIMEIDPENKNAIAYLNLINGVDAASGEGDAAAGDAAPAGGGNAAGAAGGDDTSPELDSLLD